MFPVAAQLGGRGSWLEEGGATVLQQPFRGCVVGLCSWSVPGLECLCVSDSSRCSSAGQKVRRSKGQQQFLNV